MWAWLAQVDPEAIKAAKAVAMAFPTAAGMLAVMLVNERRSGRREKRLEAQAALRDRAWADVAEQNNRVAIEGQRLQEKTLDFIQEASESLGRATAGVGQYGARMQAASQRMDEAVRTFERHTP